MKYRVSLPVIEDQFTNCWNSVVKNLRMKGYSDGLEVVRVFKEQFSITLSYDGKGEYIGKKRWVWSHLTFKSKSAFILWMLVWS